MDLFSKIKKQPHKPDTIWQPSIFDLKTQKDQKAVADLIESGAIDRIIETFHIQNKELAEVRDPSKISHPTETKTESKTDPDEGVWVYFPWRKSLIHLLAKSDYIELRTSRNSHLITLEEQKKFEGARIGFAGLNVGNPGAVCITLEGGSRQMKLADLDPLSVSNMNRFNTGIDNLGVNKVISSARQIFEIDPFMEIELYEDGIKPENIDKFLLEPKIDLLIEEMDNLKLKILIRERAKLHRIPVIMVTAAGILDIERYDLEPDLPIMAGNLRAEVMEGINNVVPSKGNLRERVMLARDFIGKDLHSQRLNEAFEKIGTEIP